MKRFSALVILLFILSSTTSISQHVILDMKKRAEVRDNWLKERMISVLPEIMRRNDTDMWVIISREYNEDPVIRTMLPATWLNARRRTILVIYDQGEEKGLECMAIARYDVGETFKKAWNKEKQPDQWQRLMDVITERNPNKIALNYSETFGLADGISATEHRLFTEKLPKKFKDRVVSGENLAIGWLETRTANEMVVYKQLCSIAHGLIDEFYSNKVIQPGVTTTNDVVWWLREKIRDLNLVTWFHPSVAVQRANPESFDHLRSFSKRPDDEVIMPGDLLHCDIGITYLGLNTDTQQHSYVLRAGETEPPQYLQDAFKKGNRLQDIMTSKFAVGTTGNKILKATREQAIAEGITPSIYTHPLGFHGHAAGPTIGLWDQQGGVPGKGDYPMYANTAYSIELNASVEIPEWGKSIRIMLEEDAYFDGEKVHYINGRQIELKCF